MNALIYSILGGVIATLLSGMGGYYIGHDDGETAGRDAATVTALEKQNVQQARALQAYISAAEQHRQLIEQSDKASQRLRSAAAQRVRSNRKQLQALKDELETTKNSRTDCVLPAGGVQRAEAARQHAIRAAGGAK